MPEPQLTSQQLQQRQQAARAEAERAELTPLTSLDSLLEASELGYLAADLADKTSVSDLQSRLLANRPLFLDHIRLLGVTKLGERQKLANAIGKYEKSGQLPLPTRRFPHLEPPIYDEEDGQTMTVRLKVPAGTAPNQLTLNIEFNTMRAEYCGGVTAAHGTLCGSVKPPDCTWQIERAPQPDYDPLVDASEQAELPDDTMVISLQKEEGGSWKSLFTDSVARRYVAPPKPPTERELAQEKRAKEIQHEKDLVKRDMLYGRLPPDYKPKKMDLSGTKDHWRAHKVKKRDQFGRGGGGDDGFAESDAPTLSAKEHWQSASATILWREGAASFSGAPDHPEECGPLYKWVETRSEIIVSAQTERGLPASELSLKANRSSVECYVRGRATPWCGFLVGHVEPSKCRLEVVPSKDPNAISDTLQLTLHKAEANRLWRAPWPELITNIELREKRAARLHDKPTRSMLQVGGGWDELQKDGEWELVVPFKHGLDHDDLRVGVTTNPSALNVYIAGREEEPLLGGQLTGLLDPDRCSWRVRAAKAKGTMKIDEIVINLAKAKGNSWRGFFKKHYV